MIRAPRVRFRTTLTGLLIRFQRFKCVAMNKIKKTRKLSLTKTVVKALTEQELSRIEGATGDLCLLTPSCTFVCSCKPRNF